MTSYVCENCSRRCLWVHEPGATDAPRCPCGVVLDAAPLPLGVYEVVVATVRAERTEVPAPPAEEPASVRQEADVGYGASHGYSPSHGGPTGPGDAPAGGDGTSQA